ncbi:MAG: hypothetical protein N3F66_09020 [Spirochaetes bacterium]|nr:hypothetical protein [Spirochaetota bacterium]
MFYLLLRLLYEEMAEGKITKDEYYEAVIRIASLHGIKRNGIR